MSDNICEIEKTTQLQYSPITTQLIITQIFVYIMVMWLPKYFTMEFYKGIIGK